VLRFGSAQIHWGVKKKRKGKGDGDGEMEKGGSLQILSFDSVQVGYN
jgi:hypothetical protein